MKNVTHHFISLGFRPSAGSFGFNSDTLVTNLRNPTVLLGGLIIMVIGNIDVFLYYFVMRFPPISPMDPSRMICRPRALNNVDLLFFIFNEVDKL